MDFDWFDSFLNHDLSAGYDTLDNHLDSQHLETTNDFSSSDIAFLDGHAPYPGDTNEYSQLGEGNVIGDPSRDGMYYQPQTYDDTCAIVSQQGILKEFGVDLTENQLRDTSFQHGWYTPGGGTRLCEIGNLLELHGVETHQVSNAGLEDITGELAMGHKVIVGLDASEIWNPESGSDISNWWRAELPDQGHAVWLTGIDLEGGVVYLNDPGQPMGQSFQVDIADFQNAWEDFGNFYCSTNSAPGFA